MFFSRYFWACASWKGPMKLLSCPSLFSFFPSGLTHFFQMFIMMWKDHNKRNYGTGFSGNIFVCKISGRLNPKIRFLIVKL